LDGGDQRGLVQNVSLNELDLVEDVFDAIHGIGTGPPDHPDYSIALVKKELSQVRAILAGYSGD
jgi:hypothetical protein